MDATAKPASPAVEPLATATRFGRARVLKLGFGIVGLLAAIAFIGAGVAMIWALETHRDASGYFTPHTHHYRTSSYALSTESVDVSGIRGTVEAGLGKLRITATSADATKPLFIGIARTRDVRHYLAPVEHE